MIKKVVNKEYNQFKEDINDKTWNQLNQVIDDLNKEISNDLSVFKQKTD